MNIIIDKEKCIGCGTCAAMAGNTFEMNGELAVLKDPIGDNEETVKMAVESCPTDAISVE